MKQPDLSSPIFGGMLTFQAFADAAGITVRSVENYAAQGLPVHRLGKRRLIDPTEAAEWIKNRTRAKRGRPARQAA